MDLNRAGLDDVLAAHALDALEAEDAALLDDLIAADAEVAAAFARLQETAGWLGTQAATTPPPSLRDRVLEAACARRPPGSSPTVPVSPARAYVAQVDRLVRLLAAYPSARWDRSTAAGFTVHEVMAHLLGVEHYTASLLGIDDFEPPPGTETDHVGMTLPTIDAHRRLAPEATVEAWTRRAQATARHVEGLTTEDLARRVSLYGLDVSVRSLLVVRVFELWTHADDIRVAAGLDREPPAPSTLAVMSAAAVRALPLGMLLAGIDAEGATARVVLTGPGGGTWIQPLAVGASPGAPSATVVADVVDFCRLAAKRLDPDALDAAIDGDPEVARKLLVAAQVFAA